MTTINSETREAATGELSPEFIQEREAFYVNRAGKKVYLGCSDERDMTDESVAAFDAMTPEDTLRVEDAFLSVFGGVAGISKNILIVGIVQYGPEFIERVGGLSGAFKKVVTSMKSDASDEAAIPTLHSAANNENDPATFCQHGNDPVGCAYCGGVGATSGLIVSQDDPLIRDVAHADMIRVFGNDDHYDDLVDGHQILLDTATDGRGSSYAITRQDYVASELPVMILAGRPHMDITKTGVITSFVPDEVRSSKKADAVQKDFYSQEIFETVKLVRRIFAEYDLDPELLMRSFLLDSTPVRAVLASHDADPRYNGVLDPRNLAMGVRGDVQSAVATLKTA